VVSYNDNLSPSVITARTGKVEEKADGTWLTLIGGQRYAGVVGEHEFENTSFESYQVHIANAEVESKKRKVEALSTLQLIGVDDTQYQAELQWRIAIPVSILLITFMAVPMAKVNPRQGRYAKLLPALALYLTFFLLLSTAKSFIEDGVLPAISIWGVQLLFFIIGLILHLQTVGKFSINTKKVKKSKADK